MKKTLVTIACWSMYFASGTCQAFSGHDVMRWLSTYNINENAKESYLLMGYVYGLQNDGQGKEFCVPESALNGHILFKIREYALSNPVMIPGNGAVLVKAALKQNYPCKS